MKKFLDCKIHYYIIINFVEFFEIIINNKD